MCINFGQWEDLSINQQPLLLVLDKTKTAEADSFRRLSSKGCLFISTWVWLTEKVSGVWQLRISKGRFYFSSTQSMSVPLTVPTLKTGHLKKNCPITTFSEAKDSQLFFPFFVCKPTNNIHKLRVIHIGVEASTWSFNQLDNCVLPRKALYWPYFVPRIIL